MAEKSITIIIKGKVGYEDEITVAQAAQIISFLNASQGEGTALGSGAAAGALGGGHSPASSGRRTGKAAESARDALDLSGAKTNPEKIVALGEYVLQDGGETFKVEDVKAQFRRARETAPANFSRDLAAAVDAGWIAQDGGEEYYITNKIQGIFDGGFKFPRASNGVGKARRSVKSAKTKSEKPTVFAEIDEFPTKLDGFPPYSKMKAQKDKLLWTLQFAKVNSIRGLANRDIAWLTDHLGAGIPSGAITSAFNSAKTPGYANRSTQDQTIRITDDGTDYLRTIVTPES